MAKKPPLDIPEQEIYHFLQATKRRQLLWTTGILSLIVASLAVLRVVMLGTQSSLFVGPVGSILLLAVFVAVKNGFSIQIASTIVLTILIGMLLVLGAISGGIDGPILLCAPFIPLLATLLHGRSAGIVCALFAGAIVCAFALASSFGIQLSVDEYHIEQRGVARAGILLAFTIASTLIALHHSRLRDSMAASIWQHANKDHLTGVANRRKIDTTLERELGSAIRNKSPLSVLLIDIDKFKLYNDVNGHLMGDICLRSITEQLEQTVQRPADLVGRFGGEEFIAILPDTSLLGSAGVAERMRAAVHTQHIPYTPGGHECVTVSIGVAVAYLPEHYNSAKLLELADEALYKAKEGGRNRVEIAGNVGNLCWMPNVGAANDKSPKQQHRQL